MNILVIPNQIKYISGIIYGTILVSAGVMAGIAISSTDKKFIHEAVHYVTPVLTIPIVFDVLYNL